MKHLMNLTKCILKEKKQIEIIASDVNAGYCIFLITGYISSCRVLRSLLEA